MTTSENETHLLGTLTELIGEYLDEPVMVGGAVVMASIIDSSGRKREVHLQTGLSMYECMGLATMYLRELELRYEESSRNTEGNIE